ncbi:hypothetical protein KY284_008500 [Solanum tuberosum]|nr:hypothetical protein KY284_008500 [Solanum tuberosum]
MHRITEVMQDFYGSSSSKRPFNSLEKLEFEDMREWNQWHVLGTVEFPKLEKLSIENCPKLMGKLPENLSSLEELKISRCHELNLETPIRLSSLKRFEVIGTPKVGVVFDETQLFRSQVEGMKQIVELSIFFCNSLTFFPFSILPITLKRIRISRCQKLKLDAPVDEMFLEELRLEGCHSIDDISPELLPTARYLRSESFHLQMTYLNIWNCEKLKWLPEIELFNLQVLQIDDCKKLVNRVKEWCLQRFPCLRELAIKHNGSDQHWELPCSIRRLESMLEPGQLPSSLSELRLHDHHELHSLHLWHLTSLLHLDIFHCPNLQSLSESALPSSLSQLTIENCPNLQSLSKSALPSSLSLCRPSWIALIYNHSPNQHCPPPSLGCPSIIALISSPFL